MRSIRGTKKIQIDSKVPRKKSTKPSARSDTPSSALSDALKRTLDTYGLSQEELAELLSGFTGQNIARTALSGWLRGAEPRISSDIILDALNQVAKHEGKSTQSAYVEAHEVKAFVAQQLEQMTRKQLMLAAEMPQSTFWQWEQGLVRVNRRRFERIKSLIEMWKKVATEAGALK